MAGPSRLDKPKNRKKAVQLLVGGATQGRVAGTIGVSPSAVCRWTKRPDVRGWIQKEAQKYLEALPDALQMSKNIIRAGQGESSKLLERPPGNVDHKLIEMAMREGEAMRKAVGIQPTATPSHIVNNFFTNSVPGLSPIIARLLATAVPQIIPEGETPDFVGPEGVNEKNDAG